MRGGPAHPKVAGGRPRGPAGRRRVRRRHARPRDPTEAVRVAWRLVEAFRAPFASAAPSSTPPRASGSRSRTADRRGRRPAPRGRHRALRRQGRRAATGSRCSTRSCAPPVTARLADRGRPAPRARARASSASGTSPRSTWRPGASSPSRRCCAGTTRTASCCTADRFIEVAEETGLILDIGDWVLREACRQAARWAAGGPTGPLTVRVNLSALQLAEAGLLDGARRRARRERRRPGAAVRRDHRDGAAARDRGRARQPRRHPRRAASASPSTTSAPATPR